MGKLDEAIQYNKFSATHLGWEPIWFDANYFDGYLIDLVKRFQKEHKLVVDGLVGGKTYKAIVRDRECKLALWEAQQREKEKKIEKKNLIYFGDKTIEFKGGLFVGMKDEGALLASSGKYRSRGGKDIKIIAIHHDAALSSKSCHSILEKRGLSIHFMIDYPGVIYQSVDLIHSAQHAVSANSFSIGIEICNPIEVKYDKYYTSKQLESRPIIKKWVSNGKTYKNFLGYYPVQITSLKFLLKTLCEGLGLPLECPGTNDFSQDAYDGNFRGVVGHYNVDPDKSKWDAAGIDLKELLEQIKRGAM